MWLHNISCDNTANWLMENYQQLYKQQERFVKIEINWLLLLKWATNI